MGFQVTVRGVMTLPEAQFSGWKRGKVDPKKFADWSEHVYAGVDETASVSKLLDRYAVWSDPNEHDYLRLTVDAGNIAIEGTLQEGSFDAIGGLVAGLWRSAARFGGIGELTFTGEGIDLEDKIIINGRTSRFVTKYKKKKINESTTPEEARDQVWLHVMNDQMQAARRVVADYMEAKRPMVPEVAFEFLSAFDGAAEKAGPVVDAIVDAIESELAGSARSWRAVKIVEGDALAAFKNDFLNKLMFMLNAMGREWECGELFEHWRDGGGEVTLSNYGRYFYVLAKLQQRERVPPALEAFDALWLTIKPNARASGDAAAIFANAACAAAMTGAREEMLRLIVSAIEFKHPREKIAADPDFTAYRKDPDFLALVSG